MTNVVVIPSFLEAVDMMDEAYKRRQRLLGVLRTATRSAKSAGTLGAHGHSSSKDVLTRAYRAGALVGRKAHTGTGKKKSKQDIDNSEAGGVNMVTRLYNASKDRASKRKPGSK